MQHIRKLFTKIRSMIKFCYVSKVSTDNEDVQLTQVTYFGMTKKIQTIAPYGLYSNLPYGSKVLMFNILGQEEHNVGVGFSQKNRFRLKDGEVLLGNPVTRSYVYLDQDGNIEISSTNKVKITSSEEIEIVAGKDTTINVSGAVTLTSTGNVNVNAPQVNLGSGGEQIARLGDAVQVNTGTGTGTITSAGTNTSI